MGTARIFFLGCLQDSQEYGSDDEHMVSRVFFTLNYEGVVYEGLYVDIKQAVGADFESAPLEVGTPQGYKGPFNHETFRRAAEEYYRTLVGSTGSAIQISGGKNIRMMNNRFDMTRIAEIEIRADKGGW